MITNCKFCNGRPIKRGFNKDIQRYFCKGCKHYYQEHYSYKLCTKVEESTIVKLNNIGVGISGIAEFTGISKANVVNKIKQIASKITKQVHLEDQQTYEVDEMHTFIGNKKNPCYIIYAINKRTRKVIDYTTGKRSKENIKTVIETLKMLNPVKICTDKLNVYPGLIIKPIHSTILHQTNRIERFNLTLRTHLKRLSRKTICFSKSQLMLESCLRIYFQKASIQV